MHESMDYQIENTRDTGLGKEVAESLHVEEMVKEDSGQLEQPSPEAEKRLLRKLDMTILPWIMLMYFLSYMDRYGTITLNPDCSSLI